MPCQVGVRNACYDHPGVAPQFLVVPFRSTSQRPQPRCAARASRLFVVSYRGSPVGSPRRTLDYGIPALRLSLTETTRTVVSLLPWPTPPSWPPLNSRGLALPWSGASLVWVRGGYCRVGIHRWNAYARGGRAEDVSSVSSSKSCGRRDVDRAVPSISAATPSTTATA